MPTIRHIMVAAIAVPALLFGGVACSDDDNAAQGDSSASAQDVDAINARIQRNEMITAALSISALPLHDIDEELAAGGEIPSNAIPSMRTLIRMLSLTNWDASLQEDATAVQSEAEAVIEAIETDDHGAAAEHAHEVHEASHDFVSAAWELVAPGTGGEGSGEETPHAEETPHDEGEDETPEATP